MSISCKLVYNSDVCRVEYYRHFVKDADIRDVEDVIDRFDYRRVFPGGEVADGFDFVRVFKDIQVFLIWHKGVIAGLVYIEDKKDEQGACALSYGVLRDAGEGVYSVGVYRGVYKVLQYRLRPIHSYYYIVPYKVALLLIDQIKIYFP